jgi:hypothetical protein
MLEAVFEAVHTLTFALDQVSVLIPPVLTVVGLAAIDTVAAGTGAFEGEVGDVLGEMALLQAANASAAVNHKKEYNLVVDIIISFAYKFLV